MGENCPCGGEKSPKWHRNRDIPLCAKAREVIIQESRAYRERKKYGIPAWIPGTDIEIEEFEQL